MTNKKYYYQARDINGTLIDLEEVVGVQIVQSSDLDYIPNDKYSEEEKRKVALKAILIILPYGTMPLIYELGEENSRNHDEENIRKYILKGKKADDDHTDVGAGGYGGIYPKKEDEVIYKAKDLSPLVLNLIKLLDTNQN